MAFRDLKKGENIYVYDSLGELIEIVKVVQNNFKVILVETNQKQLELKISNPNNNQITVVKKNGEKRYLRVKKITTE